MLLEREFFWKVVKMLFKVVFIFVFKEKKEKLFFKILLILFKVFIKEIEVNCKGEKLLVLIFIKVILKFGFKDDGEVLDEVK